jgi:hypothetical protein
VKLHLAYWWIWWDVQNETKYATSSSAACGRKEGKREKKRVLRGSGPGVSSWTEKDHFTQYSPPPLMNRKRGRYLG